MTAGLHHLASRLCWHLARPEHQCFAAVDEKSRVVELNSKLHELCRELRKENALLLDTSKAISAQELNQRKALTENFQETVEGITKR